MADIYSILAGNLGSEQDYLNRDPFYRAAGALSQAQVTPTSSTEAFLLPLLQGLGTGTLAGVGREQANKKAYEDYRSNPLFSGIEAYQSEAMPEDWTIQKGQQTGILQALAGQQQQEQQLQQLKLQQELGNSLMKEGMALDASGNIVPLAGYNEAQVARESAKKQGQILGELQAYGGSDTDTASLLNPVTKAKNEMTDSLRKEISALPEYQTFSKVQPAVKALANLATENTKASDLAFVYEAIKVLDPDSVVREGEIALTENASPWLKRNINQFKAGLTGQSAITPEIKQELLKQLKYKANEVQKQYETVVSPRLEIAKKRGLNVDELVPLNTSPLIATGSILQKRGADGNMYNVRDLGNGQFEIIE